MFKMEKTNYHDIECYNIEYNMIEFPNIKNHFLIEEIESKKTFSNFYKEVDPKKYMLIILKFDDKYIIQVKNEDAQKIVDQLNNQEKKIQKCAHMRVHWYIDNSSIIFEKGNVGDLLDTKRIITENSFANVGKLITLSVGNCWVTYQCTFVRKDFVDKLKNLNYKGAW
jgi:hypothetical protein